MKIVLSPTIKYIVTPAIGFGLAGLIWGWEAYRGTVGAGETFTNPFSYILGAVAFGILGSLSLVLFSGDKKKIAKVVILGTIGWVIAFLVPLVFAYQFVIFGAIILSIVFSPLDWVKTSDGTLFDIFVEYTHLKPSLDISNLWMEFLLTGFTIGIVYVVISHIKIFKNVFYTAGLLAVLSIVAPIVGNAVGNLFDSLLISYFITFGLIGITLGLLLGRVMNYQKE